MPWRRKTSGIMESNQNPEVAIAGQSTSSTSATSGSGIRNGHDDDTVDIESDDPSSSYHLDSLRNNKPDGWGARHTLAILGFWGFVASYAMRVNLSIAIVAMVSDNSSSGGINGNSSRVAICLPHVDLDRTLIIENNMSHTLHSAFEYNSHSQENSGEFHWDGEDQGIILGSFFWGYVITQVPGGMLAERIGGKWPFGIGMLITAIFSLLTPMAARTGKGCLIAVRVIQGLGEGVTNPSMHALLAKWLPPLERSKLGAFVYAGAQIGTVIALPLCGFLISSGLFGGWPAVFYVMGIGGIIWFIFWTIFVHSIPANHPRIEARELSYIQHSIGAQSSKHKVPTPWRKMLTSMPVIAILVAQTGNGWGLYTLLTELPTYMKNVFHLDIKSNGWLSALPYFTMFLVSLTSSWLADFLQEMNIASTTTVRKLFNTIAHWGPAIALILAGYSGCDWILAISLLTIAVGSSGACYAGFQVNHLDIAANHAAVLMGITNGFANLCGIGAPYVAGIILNNGGTLNDWKLIFFIAAGVMFCDNLFYIIFASGEEQPWNRDQSKTKDESQQIGTKNHQDRAPLLTDSDIERDSD